MKLSTRLWIIILTSFLGTLLIGGIALYDIRLTLIHEKQHAIRTQLTMANTVLEHYATAERQGQMTREQAQSAARSALAMLRDGDTYIFARDRDQVMVVHPKTDLIGKKGNGGMMPDGKTSVVEAYEAALGQGRIGFVEVPSTRPGSTESVQKLNGVMRFDAWNWTVGSGVYLHDITETFWQSATLLLVGALVLLGIVGGLGFVMSRGILATLGGEPAFAVSVAERIASGDLSSDFPVKGGEHSLLGVIKTMQTSLRGMIEHIEQSSRDLAATAADMVGHMDKLGAASENASSSTSSAAAAIEELSVSIDQVRDSARHTEEDSQAVAALAKEGSSTVRVAVDNIRSISGEMTTASAHVDELNQLTRTIGGIVDTIRDIADQTNLLALNAAIEAARAGETGRGFAVVADEVRKLAERTSKSTDEISGIIQTVVSETGSVATLIGTLSPMVDKGVGEVGHAAELLGQISDKASETLDRIHNVAHAMSEQSIAGTQIAGSVESVAGIVDETRSAVDFTVSASAHLRHLAEDLHQTVSRFRL
ncbi:methyl-accepting chemotaxis protein [Paludibacterium paludis]|uniref:Methyl-accepting chemotaxis protein n=1 Tax=Paludibacterium paludis TaxID=1225769 RepID=A0A918NWY2_9NEIS|nr:methyl-accepting chemotaxis protein [Paludibacterium paludis]GGY02384.1 methyl-accepting chemotaxis protein [Paludibacterium paludis]